MSLFSLYLTTLLGCRNIHSLHSASAIGTRFRLHPQVPREQEFPCMWPKTQIRYHLATHHYIELFKKIINELKNTKLTSCTFDSRFTFLYRAVSYVDKAVFGVVGIISEYLISKAGSDYFLPCLVKKMLGRYELTSYFRSDE
jgi:hypothetical protein